jgi:sulfite reductase (NADPH) flavoprotein alpha-component
VKVPYIPQDAPFNGEQRFWLAGFLAGLHSRQAMASQAMASQAMASQAIGSVAPVAQSGAAAPVEQNTKAAPVETIDILYGTQTGNAEELAYDAADMASTRGFETRVSELDAIDMAALSAMTTVIIVVSTYGEGEMPDNANMFWQALSAAAAPRLEGLSFGVLALGDTGYDDFCQAGKVIDTRLEQLGATRLRPRVDCDVDFEDMAAEWLEDTLPSKSTAAPLADVPKSNVVPLKAKSSWSRSNPYVSTVTENRLLSGPGSAKEIRHFCFDLGDSGINYETGDALGVFAKNAPDLVKALITRLGVQNDSAVKGYDQPLVDLLTNKFEIMTPPKELIREIEKRAADEELSHVISTNDKDALIAYMWGKDTLDLLNLNPDMAINLDEFISWLKPLQHRAYSISSSPKVHPGEVHLTVAAVRWAYQDRQHKGVCSTFLSDMILNGDSASIFVAPNNNFRVPQDNDAPMIMVGPGTGIAPFRAFLEERQARGATGRNWLFFGDQHRAHDFIYQDELAALSDAGVLHDLDLAFSRDQDKKNICAGPNVRTRRGTLRGFGTGRAFLRLW